MKSCAMYKITYVSRKKQLEERGAALADSLFERRGGRVTFAQFRNGLLAALGAASEAAAPPEPPDPTPSDEDSSGREVAPRFVFGSKKYGRRSRPQRAEAPPSPVRASSASRLDSDDRRARRRPRCRRSASAMDARDEGGQLELEPAVEHDRRIDRDEALVLCRGLDMDRIDRELVERIFEDSGAADTTVGEFFDRLNSSLTATVEEATRESDAPAAARDDGSDDEADAGAGLAAELVLAAWRRAGVPAPRRLLADLGFGGAALRPCDLERALDEELRSPPDGADTRSLPAAALALARLRLERLRLRATTAAAERDKLRADVSEANRRARILAQEVDDSHARIEAELKASLGRAEARRADAERRAAVASAAEREAAAADRARLETELARRVDSEARSRTEADEARRRADEAEARTCAAEERAARSEREAAHAAAEWRAARAAVAAPAPAASGAAVAGVAELRAENRRLRDRVDELCAALETRARSSSPALAAGDLSAELQSVLPRERREDCDSSPVGERDVSGPAELAPGQGGPAPTAERAAQTDAPADEDAVRGELLDSERRHDDEKRKLGDLVRELESSLELMRAEYDKCEEYWSGKLREERELLAEEQRAGDERLAELVARVADYERQFAGHAALPTIDERHSLEAQFTQLEEEFARYRADKEAELEGAERRASELEARLAQVQAQAAQAARARRRARDLHSPVFTEAPRAPGYHVCVPGEGAGGAGDAAGAGQAGGVRELRVRTARAEAAVRRLHARLAAADLLVKDLYVENCQLAHRPL